MKSLASVLAGAVLVTHHPKGGMCRVCRHRARDCSHLQFDKMRVIDKYDNKVIVKCEGFKRE